MLYNILITGKDLERPKSLSSYTNVADTVDILNKYSRYRKKVGQLNDIVTVFNNSYYAVTRYDFIDKYIIVGSGLIVEVIDKKYKILLVRTSKNLYISKDLATTPYVKLYKTLQKEIITPSINSELDIVYTDNPGKYTFMTLVPPKFKTIGDRKDFVDTLVSNYYANKQSN